MYPEKYVVHCWVSHLHLEWSRCSSFSYRWFEHHRLSNIQRQGMPLKVFIIFIFISIFSIIIYIYIFLRLCLVTAKRDTQQKLGTSDKLWLRSCFSLMRNPSGERKLLFLWIAPREALSNFLVKGGNFLPQANEYPPFHIHPLVHHLNHKDKWLLISALMFSQVASFWML